MVQRYNNTIKITIRYVDTVHMFKTNTLFFKTILSHGRKDVLLTYLAYIISGYTKLHRNTMFYTDLFNIE